MSETILGTTDQMAMQRAGLRWTAALGEVAFEEWKGPYAVALAFYRARALSGGTWDQVTLDRQGPVGVVVMEQVQESSGSQHSDDDAVWEVSPIEISKDLREHPYFTHISGAIWNDLAKADARIKHGEPYNADDYVWEDAVKRYYALRCAGTDTYVQSGLSLKKTIVVSSRSTITAAYENVNRQVALSTIKPPKALLGNLTLLPVITDYASLDAPQTPTIVNGDWEWLKKMPTVRSVSGSMRWEIQYEWWGADKWSAVTYQGTWDPEGL